HRKFLEAQSLEERPALTHSDAIVNQIVAQRTRKEGQALLDLQEHLIGRGSTELMPHPGSELAPKDGTDILNTLEHPNTISLAASQQRSYLASRADVLSPALDAAVSAQASNSFEKMLCHQLAAAHEMAMGLIGDVRPTLATLPPVEKARLVNASARMMEAFQMGVLTLQKLKLRGNQHVVVQYQQVNVAPGGRAVVTGKLGRGSRRRGRGSKNGR